MEFLNMLGDKFCDISRTVTRKTRENVEATKLASQLRSAKAGLEKQYAAFGRVCYDLKTGKGSEAPVESAFDRLQGMIALVEKLSAQLDEKRNVSRCPVCGNETSVDALFCSRCGSKLSGEAQPAAAEEPADDDSYIHPSEWKLPEDDTK